MSKIEGVKLKSWELVRWKEKQWRHRLRKNSKKYANIVGSIEN